MQVTVRASFPAAAAASSSALAALLTKVPRQHLDDCSETTRQLLHSFLRLYAVASGVGYKDNRPGPSHAPLLKKLWQGLAKYPSLATSVEALQACLFLPVP